MDLWKHENLDLIQRRIESFYLQWLRRRRTVLALIGVFCLLALSGLPKLRVNNTMDVWFSDQTPSYSRYKAFTETFGSDEYLFVALDLGDVFTPSNLEKLDRLSISFKAIPGVVEVMGLPTATDVRSTSETPTPGAPEALIRGAPDVSHDEAEGGIYVHELRDGFGVEPCASLRRRILSDERFVQTLVSRDGSVAVFLIRFETPKVGAARVRAVEDLLRSAEVEYHLGGYIFAQREMDRLTFRDYFLFGSICLAVLTILFWVLFRDIYLTAVFVLDCVLTVGVVLGCMGHFHVPIHLMTGILPPLLMAMAIADDLHLVERFLRTAGSDRIEERVARASSEVAIPSFLSGLTTFAGFFSLSGGEVPAISHFGLWSGIGILFTYVFSFLTIPILLTYSREVSGRAVADPSGRPENWMVGRALRFRLPLAVFFAGICVLCAQGVRQIVVDTQLTNFFKPESVFMRSMDFIEGRFGNTGPVEIVFTSSAADGLKDVEFLRKTEVLTARLKELPQITTVLSLNPVLKTVTQALHDGRPEDYRLPGRKDLLEQELLVLSLSASGEETLNRYVNSSWTEMRIQTRLPRMTNNEALRLLEEIETVTREVFGAEQGFYLTGVVEAYARLDRFILASQIRSLGITLLVIAMVFWLQVGRPLWAVLALLPNVFPILVMFASMGWMGISLNVATATVAAITLGLADDDTVYFFYAYIRRRKSGLSAAEALPGTFHECGRALWLATLLNVVGFSLFVFSSFRPTVYFGILTSEVWVVALLSEFFLLPSLLLLADRKSFGRPPAVSPGRGV